MRPPGSGLAIGIAIAFLACGLLLRAEEAPVSISVPEKSGWIGQRLSFYVELYSEGAFRGPTSFILPQVQGLVIVKVGDPMVSSRPINGETWFVQSHEFALFSQKEGTIQLPGFPARFGTSQGFTGQGSEIRAEVPGFQVKVTRPPGTDPDQFLVTTTALSLSEQWNPHPGKEVKTGDVFKRTITQNAEEMTGMALAPAPLRVPDGIRVYPGEASVTDETERGAFSGQRVDTLTYLVERPGSYTLPAIRYDWWNPKTHKLESKTLLATTFTAVGSVAPAASTSKRESVILPIAALILGGWALWAFRQPILARLSRIRDTIDPPHNRTARALVAACRRNDAPTAERMLLQWQTEEPGFSPDAELRQRIAELQRHLYGPQTADLSWKGAPLARAFRHRPRPSPETVSPALPPLNP